MSGEAQGSVSAHLVALQHTTTDRLFAGTVAGGLFFLLLAKSPNRVAWAVLGAALGAFVVPRFVQAFRYTEDDSVSWAIVNPFAPGGAEPVVFLTGG